MAVVCQRIGEEDRDKDFGVGEDGMWDGEDEERRKWAMNGEVEEEEDGIVDGDVGEDGDGTVDGEDEGQEDVIRYGEV